MSTKVNINIDPTDKILLKRNLNMNGKAQQFFTSEVARLSDAYVPMDTGTLKNTRKLDINKITYVQPYAKRQWSKNKGKGLRGKEWCLRMWANRGKEIKKSVAKLIGGHVK